MSTRLPKNYRAAAAAAAARRSSQSWLTECRRRTVSKCSRAERRSSRSVLLKYFALRPPALRSPPDSPGCNKQQQQPPGFAFAVLIGSGFHHANCFEASCRSIADLQQQVLDPMKTSLLATWTKLERPGQNCDGRERRRCTHLELLTIGVVCWVMGPLSPNTILPVTLKLVQKEKESSSPSSLLSVLGTEISPVPRPRTPSGASSPRRKWPVWVCPHLQPHQTPQTTNTIWSANCTRVSTRRKKESWSAAGEWRRRSFLAGLPKNNRDTDWISTILRDEVQNVLH